MDEEADQNSIVQFIHEIDVEKDSIENLAEYAVAY